MSPAIASPPGETAFPSLTDLRSAHNELLKRQPAGGRTGELMADVEAFLLRGQKTGTLLDSPEDRWSAQSALDYWASALYRAGRRDIDPVLAEFDPELAPALDDALCPYRGLEAFREDDCELFFGRARLIGEMVARLRDSRLLAALGPSGSGKSSVVLGGLLPALEAGALPGSADWRYLPPLVPGSEPLRNLARALLPAGTEAAAWISSQAEKLQSDPEHLARLLSTQGDAPAVLVVDQFEEVFTLCEDNRARQAFVAGLLGVLRTAGPRHLVILTMRSDYEAFVARLQELEPFWEPATIRVTPLGAAELREAIEKPAERVGLKLEDGVVQALLEDLLGEPAGLPLLQFTLLKLWERRERNRVTWGAYRRLGGGRLALARSADELYDGLIPEEQATARRILLRIVRPGSGLEMTSSRIRQESLYRSGEDPGRIDRVLGKLIAARLIRLTPGETPVDAQVEVAHEALVRNWPRLVDWLEEMRAETTIRRRLEARAEEWVRMGRGRSGLLDELELLEAERWLKSPEVEDLGYDERLATLVQASHKAIGREKLYWNTFRWGLAILLLLYAGAWGFYGWRAKIIKQWQGEVTAAQEEKAKAKAETKKLEEEKTKLNAAIEQARVQAQRAEQQGSRAEQQEQLALQQKLQAERVTREANRRAREAFQKVLDADMKTQQADEDARLARGSLRYWQGLLEDIHTRSRKNQHRTDEMEKQAAEAANRLAELEEKKKAAEERWKALEEELADGGGIRDEEVPRLLKRTLFTFSKRFELYPFRRPLRPVQAGIGIGTMEEKSLPGTICCVVRDAAGQRYLLSRASVFKVPSGTSVLQPGLVDSPTGGMRNVVAKVVRSGSDPNRSGAIARLGDGIEVDPVIPRLGRIEGIAEGAKAGNEVWLAGRGSGIQKGKILRVMEDGTIVTDIVPAPGDTGGPLLTPSHRILGMLWGWSYRGRESYVAPIRKVLDELSVELVTGEERKGS
jgi:hypothetical protein